MTGRQKIEAALSIKGTLEIPVVLCYESIYVRDHWSQLTSCPWWYSMSYDLDEQMQWRRDVVQKTDQDWFYLPTFYTHAERKQCFLDVRAEGVVRVNKDTGTEQLVRPPRLGGWSPAEGAHSFRPEHIADTPEEIDRLIPSPPEDPARVLTDGRSDLADALLHEFGERLYPIRHVGTPLWQCYSLWGFEVMMTMVTLRPDLVAYACGRFLALSLYEVQESRLLGAAGIWLEDCLTDMVSPCAFASLNMPSIRCLTRAIRDTGMHSIYYYCGDPSGKWDFLLTSGADALSLEESKKGFTIDIAEVVERAKGHMAVFGNLDAISLLAHGSDAQLRTEVARQITAGRRNNSRFVMSIGSPVTPETPVGRVQFYCQIAHELGRVVMPAPSPTV